MKTRILTLIFFYFLFALFMTQNAFANDLFEVTVKARGSSQEEALASAIDEAIRRSVGALFAERTQADGDVLEEKLIQFSRGIVTNYKILESASDSSGEALTVLVTVDFSKLRENSRTIIEGMSVGGIEQRRTPNLEFGQKALTNFLSSLRYEKFLMIRLENKQIDIRKRLLNVSISLNIDNKRYVDDFMKPLAGVMEEIFESPALWQEVKSEYEKNADRFAASFHVLGQNFTSRAWTLPRIFYETLKRDARFWDAKRGKIQTHKRIWLHFSLIDENGAEIERLPVHLKASNVLFFSGERKEATTPWFFMNIEPTKLKSSLTLIAAPYFGAMNGNEYEFYDSFTQDFAFILPETLLNQVNDVKIALELER
jgi:hypothetical protein